MAEQKLTWYERTWNAVEKFFSFLNGKKNKIGNAALSAYAVMEAGVQTGLIPDHTLMGQIVLIGGIAFKAIGLTHKAVKGELNNQLPEGIR